MCTATSHSLPGLQRQWTFCLPGFHQLLRPWKLHSRQCIMRLRCRLCWPILLCSDFQLPRPHQLCSCCFRRVLCKRRHGSVRPLLQLWCVLHYMQLQINCMQMRTDPHICRVTSAGSVRACASPHAMLQTEQICMLCHMGCSLRWCRHQYRKPGFHCLLLQSCIRRLAAASRLRLAMCAGLVSSMGACCAEGASLDSQGTCCGAPLDACGTCGGNGTAVDFTGSCCDGVLDAGGLCCDQPAGVDDLGVCGGNSDSGIIALTTSVSAEGGKATCSSWASQLLSVCAQMPCLTAARCMERKLFV